MAISITDWNDLHKILRKLAANGNIQTPHVEALMLTGCYAFSCGCQIRMEKNMQNGKLIFRVNEQTFFTIRSTGRGMLIEFYDPEDNLTSAKNLTIVALRHNKGQFNKYGMNRTEYFSASCRELRDAVILLCRAVVQKTRTASFQKRT